MNPLYDANFGTLCFPIGQLFEPHLVLKNSVEIVTLNIYKQNQCKTRSFTCFHMLRATRIIDRFRHKRHQKKHNWMGYECYWRFVWKYFVKREMHAVKYLFITYVCTCHYKVRYTGWCKSRGTVCSADNSAVVGRNSIFFAQNIPKPLI